MPNLALPSLTTPALLRRRDASHYLREHYGLSYAPQTLAKLACIGGGPAFRRWGSRIPVYAPADLDAWVASKLTGPLASTSTPTASIGEAELPLSTLLPDAGRFVTATAR